MSEWSTTKQTRDERRVRIICTDGPSPRFPVIGVVEGNSYTTTWDVSGNHRLDGSTEFDLVDIPQTKFINVYEPHRIGSSNLASVLILDTRAAADDIRGENRIACLEFKVGDGL